MKRMFTVLAVAAIAFTACSKEENGAVVDGGGKPIAIIPTIANPPIMPGVTSRATDTDFEAGDQIGLRITMKDDGSHYAKNQLLTYNESDFSTLDFLWYEDGALASTLFAYYPYAAGEEIPAEFTVQADQTGLGYKKSDLIVALKSDVRPSTAATTMTFKHKMTRILIDVTENTSGSDIADVVVKGAIGTATIDAATGIVAAKAGAAVLDVKANVATENKIYYALLVPQNGVTLQVSVTTKDAKTRVFTLGVTDLLSGENRRMEMRVLPKDVVVKLSGPIDAWTEGAELYPEGSVPTEDPSVEWGGVKYKIVTMKDGRTWMAENLRYVPEGKTISSDPTDKNGIWYPANFDKVADATLLNKHGLIYGYSTLLGMTEEFTNTNYDQFAGVQGICPDGWHIPTQAEWLTLLSVEDYKDTADGIANLPKLNADNFNIFGCSYVNATNITATPTYNAIKSAADQTAYGMAYYATSTASKVIYNTTDDPESGIKNIQYFAAMITYNANNHNMKATTFQGAYGGAPVRCIQNVE